LHKLRLRFNELLSATTAAILERAAQPEPFELPVVPPTCQTAVDDWQLAVDVARQQSEVVRQRRADASATLNRQTFDFIRHGASVGDRHRLLFSAAANLAEFGCPPALAHALLSEPGLDAGLPPGEVRRQIECGLSHSSHNSD
jgi:serine/threonine protein kinase HipA of HipAB toxin-antitoxin module